MVLYNHNKKRYVVDGQQRLITLNLLLRAFFNQCGTLEILEKILYKKNKKTGNAERPYQIKIKHNVLGDNENKKLEAAILGKEQESSYQDNYNEFVGLTKNKIKELNVDEKETFILTLIDIVVLLPIECTDFDSALTIFETINNRGMDLSDADIFKSKLYKYAGDAKEEFISRWNELVSHVDAANTSLKDIFTRYMHVLRGKENNVDTLVGLRKFYDQDNSIRLQNWKEVMDSLDKLVWGWSYIHEEKYKAPIEIINWSIVLSCYPNVYWQYPIMTFLHSSIEADENGDITFTGNNDNLLNLQKEIARYCYWKWLKYRGVGAIKDTIFKVVRDIAQDKDYTATLQKDIHDEGRTDKQNTGAFKDILKRDLGRGLRGICLLVAVLNDGQTSRSIPEDFQIEHILPKKWDYYKYDGWSHSAFETSYNRLGNLVPLEKSLNIKASHRFFAEKKRYYYESIIEEAYSLGKDNSLNAWTPDEFNERDKEIIDRVINFLLKKATD